MDAGSAGGFLAQRWGGAVAVGLRAVWHRSRKLTRTALVLTAGASVLVSGLGLIRQKALARVLGAAGIADLSLLLSIALPLSTLALWPMLSFIAPLNAARLEERDRHFRTAAAVCLAGYVLVGGAAFIVGQQTDIFRYPLGTREGLNAALVFGLGLVGTGYAASGLILTGQLRRWRQLTALVALCQLVFVVGSAWFIGRRGAVWSMSLSTGIIGVLLLVIPLVKGPRGSLRLPGRWVRISLANGVVSMSLIGVEATLRQASAASSLRTAAYLQASLSIIGAISAGVGQYIGGRLLPVASAARVRGEHREAWEEARRCLRAVGLFMALISSLIAVLAPVLLGLAFSSEFEGAESLVRLIALGETMVTIAAVISATLLGLGKISTWAGLSVLPAVARVLVYLGLSGATPTARLGSSYVVSGVLAVALAFFAYRRFTTEQR